MAQRKTHAHKLNRLASQRDPLAPSLQQLHTRGQVCLVKHALTRVNSNH